MSLDISLCVYTNCSKFNSNDVNLISTTIESFNNTFNISNINKIIVFIDSNPETQNFHTYQRQIENYLQKWKDKNPQIVSTLGLSDGYLKSLYLDTEYIFQLEHDWTFINENINHSLEEIISLMKRIDLPYLRFNKRDNIPYFWDKYIKEIETGCDIKICKTPNVSNNPHIINKKIYLKNEWDKLIKFKTGSHGIEEEFNKNNLVGYLYGESSYPATIKHIDGKRIFNNS